MQGISYFFSFDLDVYKRNVVQDGPGTILEAGLPRRIPGVQIPEVTPLSFRASLSLGSARSSTLSPIQTTSMKEIIMVVASKTTFVMEDVDLNSIRSALIKTFFIRLLY